MPKETRGMDDFLGLDNLYEDQDGFIWFLSDHGMFRYDGVELMPVKSDPVDLNSLSSNRIKDVIQDEQGVFWITTRNGGLNAYDPMEGKFTHYRHDPNDTTTLSTDDLFFLQKDPAGKLWIGSTAGMNIFDPNTGRNIRIMPRPGVSGELQGQPWSPIIITAERVYVATTAGLEYFNQKERKWHFFPVLDETGDTIRISINRAYSPIKILCMDRKGLLWMGIPDRPGLWVFDPKTSRLTDFGLRTAGGKQIPAPGTILEGHSGRLWIVSQDDIWRVSTDRKTLEQCEVIDVERQQRQKGLSPIFQDHNGLIWLRTASERSPFYFDPGQEIGQTLKLPSVQGQIPKTFHIVFDSNGLIWLCTNSGVMRYNPFTGETRSVMEGPACYQAILLYDDYLLVTSDRGLIILEKKSGQSWPVRLGSAREKPIPGAMCAAIDLDGDLWFSTWGNGLYRLPKGALDARTGIAATFEQWKNDPSDPESLPSNLLQSIAVDADNKVWVCGAENGLNLVDKNTRKVQRFMYEQGNVNGIVNNYTSELQVDKQGDIWISLGWKLLERFSPKTGHFKKYGASEGLPNYRISEIAVDKAGKIWMNQTQVVSCIDPASGEINIFPQVAAASLYNEAIAVHPKTNEVYFGLQQKLRSFNPSILKEQNKAASPLQFSKVSHYDTEGNGAMRSLPGNRWKKTPLSLSHRENTVEIEFALLDYLNPQSREYAYSLTKSGSQPRWIYTGSKNTVSFANLAPGSYLFSVKGRNSYGVWNEQPATLPITIRPPWWATWWAYLAYAIVAVLALIGVRSYDLRRKLAAAEARRLRELDNFKNRFFTNITHEFRTPLTVILGTSEQVEEQVGDGLKSKLRLIRRNGEGLLRLINQILDLAKLESNALKINYVQGDILPYLRYISESLHSVANARNVMLRVESNEASIVMDYDPERLLQIVHNLLSNAVKFTPSGGKVTLRADRVKPHDLPYLYLSVADTGAGIPEEDLPHIFDRFHQASNLEKAATGGTGIGLALAKELVYAMNGEIEVESEVGKGTAFTVKLPITHNAEAAGQNVWRHPPLKKEQSTTAPFPSPPTGQPSNHLLIIEDNPDIVEYLTDCLEGRYDLDFAYNGRAGIEKALETVPDLIVSDVMMPEKDGFEVCDFLKNDERTSHVPLVLLTAKADVKSRLAGLRRGADAYLAKPFHREELLVTLDNLLELRRKLQAKYVRDARFGPGAVEPGKIRNPDANPSAGGEPQYEMEDAFLQKVRAVILEHLSDATFTVEGLSQSLAMSQRQLHRKLAALTGQNASALIRSMRLAKAKELLLAGEKNVSEVAYATGFDDPKYFSRVFTKEFGLPPSKV
ncbi:MAG: response regulator [Phaeodactylibacter sp.]|nr:response regulator [Phaeodactylibacter sp.]